MRSFVVPLLLVSATVLVAATTADVHVAQGEKEGGCAYASGGGENVSSDGTTERREWWAYEASGCSQRRDDAVVAASADGEPVVAVGSGYGSSSSGTAGGSGNSTVSWTDCGGSPCRHEERHSRTEYAGRSEETFPFGSDTVPLGLWVGAVGVATPAGSHTLTQMRCVTTSDGTTSSDEEATTGPDGWSYSGRGGGDGRTAYACRGGLDSSGDPLVDTQRCNGSSEAAYAGTYEAGSDADGDHHEATTERSQYESTADCWEGVEAAGWSVGTRRCSTESSGTYERSRGSASNGTSYDHVGGGLEDRTDCFDGLDETVGGEDADVTVRAGHAEERHRSCAFDGSEPQCEEDEAAYYVAGAAVTVVGVGTVSDEARFEPEGDDGGRFPP